MDACKTYPHYDYRTGLAYAVMGQSLSTTHLLVANLMDTNMLDRWGRSPLAHALDRVQLDEATGNVVRGGEIAALLLHNGSTLHPPFDTDAALIAKLDGVRKLDMYPITLKVAARTEARKSARANTIASLRAVEVEFRTSADALNWLLSERQGLVSKLRQHVEQWISSYAAPDDMADSGLEDTDNDDFEDHDGKNQSGGSSDEEGARGSSGADVRVHDSSMHVPSGRAQMGSKAAANAEYSDALFLKLALQLAAAERGALDLQRAVEQRLAATVGQQGDDEAVRAAEDSAFRALLAEDLQLPPATVATVMDDVYAQVAEHAALADAAAREYLDDAVGSVGRAREGNSARRGSVFSRLGALDERPEPGYAVPLMHQAAVVPPVLELAGASKSQEADDATARIQRVQTVAAARLMRQASGAGHRNGSLGSRGWGGANCSSHPSTASLLDDAKLEQAPSLGIERARLSAMGAKALYLSPSFVRALARPAASKAAAAAGGSEGGSGFESGGGPAGAETLARPVRISSTAWWRSGDLHRMRTTPVASASTAGNIGEEGDRPRRVRRLTDAAKSFARAGSRLMADHISSDDGGVHVAHPPNALVLEVGKVCSALQGLLELLDPKRRGVVRLRRVHELRKQMGGLGSTELASLFEHLSHASMALGRLVPPARRSRRSPFGEAPLSESGLGEHAEASPARGSALERSERWTNAGRQGPAASQSVPHLARVGSRDSPPGAPRDLSALAAPPSPSMGARNSSKRSSGSSTVGAPPEPARFSGSNRISFGAGRGRFLHSQAQSHGLAKPSPVRQLTEAHFFGAVFTWLMATAAEHADESTDAASGAAAEDSELPPSDAKSGAVDLESAPGEQSAALAAAKVPAHGAPLEVLLLKGAPTSEQQASAVAAATAHAESKSLDALESALSDDVHAFHAIADRIADRVAAHRFKWSDEVSAAALTAIVVQTVDVDASTTPAVIEQFFAASLDFHISASTLVAKGRHAMTAAVIEKPTWKRLEAALRQRAAELDESAGLGATAHAARGDKRFDASSELGPRPWFILSVHSRQHKVWQGFCLLLMLIDMLVIPMQMSMVHLVENVSWIIPFNFVFDACYLLRICVALVTSFVNDKSVEIFEPAACRRHYLAGPGMIDAFAAFPLGWIVIGMDVPPLEIYAIRFPRMIYARCANNWLGCLLRHAGRLSPHPYCCPRSSISCFRRYVIRAYRRYVTQVSDGSLLPGILSTFAVLMLSIHYLACIMNALGFDEVVRDELNTTWFDLFVEDEVEAGAPYPVPSESVEFEAIRHCTYAPPPDFSPT